MDNTIDIIATGLLVYIVYWFTLFTGYGIYLKHMLNNSAQQRKPRSLSANQIGIK